jgi:GT2 family glycosyltransferase
MDRFEDLCELLASIRSQTYPDIEAIVIVEGSSDLRDYIKDFVRANKMSNVLVMHTNLRIGASFQINLGVKKARGSIIAILHDDTVVPASWAENLINTYEGDAHIAGVTGPIIPIAGNAKMDWFPEEFDWIIGCNRYCVEAIRRKMKVRSVSGSNASFRKRAFEIAGGLSTTLGPLSTIKCRWCEIGEETELSLRIAQEAHGYIVYDPNVIVYHKIPEENLRWRFIAQMSYRTGRTKGGLKRLCKERQLLAPERELLQRILSRVLPKVLVGTLRKPTHNLQKFLLIGISLTFITFGFVSGYLFPSSLIKL